MSAARLVFLGSDPIALPLLDWLAGPGAAHAKIVAIFTQPDRPVGRGQLVQANAIKQWALRHGLPVHQPDKITETVRAELANLDASVALVMAYGHILRDDFIATPKWGTLNLHTSLLPKYRGASPIQTAVASRERGTGVSLMRIVKRLDAGPVAATERVDVLPLDTAADVEAKLASACVPLVARALPLLIAGDLSFVDQDEGAATYSRKLQKEDGALDFAAPATRLAGRINGLYPWPTCRVELNGQQLKIGLADCYSPEAAEVDPFGVGSASPGTVLGSDPEGLLVMTGGGVLRLRRLQRPGGKMLPAAEFVRGYPIPAGTMLPSVPMSALLVSR
ncbi:MAG: hypothetical protein RIQ93_120 [Verrucomicrobiota bacterium]|jgi:methionyl-tRNA formyltransferase